MKTEPNNAMERSRILVTDRAFARSAPSIRLAHLGRSARKTMKQAIAIFGLLSAIGCAAFAESPRPAIHQIDEAEKAAGIHAAKNDITKGVISLRNCRRANADRYRNQESGIIRIRNYSRVQWLHRQPTSGLRQRISRDCD